MKKRLVAVLDAVRGGCETSNQVAAVLDISIAEASSALSELFAMGLLDRDRKPTRKHTFGPGPYSFRYEAARCAR